VKQIIYAILIWSNWSCLNQESSNRNVAIYQTSAKGDKLTLLNPVSFQGDIIDSISIFPDQEFQIITGFGGAFTESSAYLLNQLTKLKRQEVMQAYFSEQGANYSLTRTHINSCDFSLNSYSYDTVPGDTFLKHFDISPDEGDLIPMIKEAQSISPEGFKIIASPWTAPRWMKDNNAWKGGQLLTEYYPTWAMYFSKYIKAYAEQGIEIWGITVENEPLGNGENWESMHFSPHQMSDFIKNHLGPQMKRDSLKPNILIYDQNRDDELKEWAIEMLNDKELEPWIYGTAVHWYSSTVDWMPGALNFTHNVAPQKHIIHTEGCIDAEVPKWQDDSWYWSKNATDWGWDWAPDSQKIDHPKYVPVYRYARDIIGCLNSWVEGWVDWNMVLDEKGGPNWAKNWCIAPVIVNTEKDEVYYTPLYYTLSHFSKFIRPEAKRIGYTINTNELMATTIRNKDGSIVVVLLNQSEIPKSVHIDLNGESIETTISEKAIQSVVIHGILD
jgi:glucosylceramidase|tara:strand:+ start:539 stop:2035 length:1497 start_codon:yes stop_codon:yes gene_type:complete